MVINGHSLPDLLPSSSIPPPGKWSHRTKEGLTFLSNTPSLIPKCLDVASSQVKALSLLPSLQCLDNNPLFSGGLVIKEVTISPTPFSRGLDISHPFRESLNLLLITHYTISTLWSFPHGVLCSGHPKLQSLTPHRAIK